MQIEVGGFYTNATGLYVREILDIFGPDVTYKEHVLSDEDLHCDSWRKCGRGTFKRWAVRPCTPEEIARLTTGETRKTRSRLRPSVRADAREAGRIEIRVGIAYTNRLERFAREVMAMKGRKVTYRDFDLSNGQSLTPPATCDVKSFRDWATRECTPEESGRLSRDDVDSDAASGMVGSLEELAAQVVGLTLRGVSDEQLLAEVRRRGLSKP